MVREDRAPDRGSAHVAPAGLRAVVPASGQCRWPATTPEVEDVDHELPVCVPAGKPRALSLRAAGGRYGAVGTPADLRADCYLLDGVLRYAVPQPRLCPLALPV